MIVAAAIRREGLVFSMSQPARHHDILNHMAQREGIDAIDVEQGFLTSGGNFVNRWQADNLAQSAGQKYLQPSVGGELFSECLW